MAWFVYEITINTRKLIARRAVRRAPCDSRVFDARRREELIKKYDSRASACAGVLHLPCFKGECTERISVCKASGGARSFIHTAL